MRLVCSKRFPQGGAGADRRLAVQFHRDVFHPDETIDLGYRWIIRFVGGRFVR